MTELEGFVWLRNWMRQREKAAETVGERKAWRELQYSVATYIYLAKRSGAEWVEP